MIHALMVCSIFPAGVGQAPPPRPPVVELLEDEAGLLLKELTNPTGDPGEGHVENTVVFSGTSAVKIVPMQRFHSRIPGWKHRIVKEPKAGEYRYLRFAWKADGNQGIMLQFHDERDWFVRYTSGIDQFNWGTKFVAAEPPGEWQLVTRDLFQDFGERTITGMALTAFGGRAAYFDHIYLGASVEALDRIDATGLAKKQPIALTPEDQERLWRDLVHPSASKAYLAFWTMVHAPKQSAPFVLRKLTAKKPAGDAVQVGQWIRELDSDQFAAREAASKNLAQHLEAATDLLEKALAGDPSVEARVRIERLLAAHQKTRPDPRQVEQAIRILEYAATPEAARGLEELARGPEGVRLTELARAALARTKGR
jgi:hypothetical protein